MPETAPPIKIVPTPQTPVSSDSWVWAQWFMNIAKLLSTYATGFFRDLDFTGSDITQIETRNHNQLQNIQGGDFGLDEYFHLSNAEYVDLQNLLTPNYGSFVYESDQLFTADDTPEVVAFDTAAASNNISVASNQITFANDGTYNIQYSLQAVNTHSQAHNLWIWVRKNGVDVDASGSKFDVPSTHGSSDGYLIAVSNVVLSVVANDYIEIVAATDQANLPGVPQQGVYFEAYTASTSPFNMPSIPSNIVTITQVGP